MEKSINNILSITEFEILEQEDEQTMKQSSKNVVDLARIEGNGEFLCPKCGNTISPDDCSKEKYSILEIKVAAYDVDKLLIQCNKCLCQIYLTGFSLTQKLPMKHFEL